MKLNPKDVKIALSEVPTAYFFKVKDGRLIKSLIDLVKALELMDQATFNHHVKDDRNDFALWVSDIIGDKELAKQISHLHDKRKMLEMVEFRIGQIRNLEMELQNSEQPKAVFDINSNESKDSNDSNHSNLKEYIYGLTIGAVMGILIGLLL